MDALYSMVVEVPNQQLTPRIIVLKKLTAAQEIPPLLIDPEDPLLYLQKPATGHYPGPGMSSPNPHTLLL
jgi:hypothetical protein